MLATARGTESVHTVRGVPTEVTNSIRRSGRAPEAAADSQAVQDKSRMEDELLASVKPAQAQAQVQVPAAPAGLGNAATSRPHLYTQDTGSYQGSGTAIVLGTDTERAFPLGGARHEAESTSTSTSVPDFAELPKVTTGLETRPTTELSEATGRGVDYSHESGATKYAEDVESHLGSRDARVPRSHDEAPIVDKVPVRSSEEETVGNGPGAYKTLSSGTPSGVRV